MFWCRVKEYNRTISFEEFFFVFLPCLIFCINAPMVCQIAAVFLTGDILSEESPSKKFNGVTQTHDT